MSVKNLQLMKWSFPALAFIIGFFWYKRRGVDRVDPGGISKSDKKSSTVTTTTSTANESNGEINIPKNNNLSLYDSGIHVEDSFGSINTLNRVSLKESVVTCSPRKVSESLDIPMKKSDSMTMSMSMRSRKSSGNSLPWYEDVEDLPEMKEIVLGSNPKSSNFDLMIRKKPPVILENIEDNNNTSSDPVSEQVIVNNVESVDKQEQVENKTQEKEDKIEVEGEDQEELEQTVVATPQIRSRSISIETCDKTNDTVSTTDESKTGQALSERDSANHSPVSGVLDGSVNDDIRSEGSTDSGKGNFIYFNIFLFLFAKIITNLYLFMNKQVEVLMEKYQKLMTKYFMNL